MIRDRKSVFGFSQNKRTLDESKYPKESLSQHSRDEKKTNELNPHVDESMMSCLGTDLRPYWWNVSAQTIAPIPLPIRAIFN